MKCSQAKKRIPHLAYGELDEAQRRNLEDHLGVCRSCRALAAEYDRLAGLSRAMPPVPLPADFDDRFVSETVTRLATASTPRRPPRVPAAPPLAWRRRFAWAGLAAAVVSGLLLLFGIDPSSWGLRRPSLESFLVQSDFRGLAEAMADAEQRNRLLCDSVSVELLIATLKQLQRSDRRHAQVGRSLADWVETVQRSQSGPPALERAQPLDRYPGMAVGKTEFDFRFALRALRNLRRGRSRVTLRELVELAAFQPKS